LWWVEPKFFRSEFVLDSLFSICLCPRGVDCDLKENYLSPFHFGNFLFLSPYDTVLHSPPPASSRLRSSVTTPCVLKNLVGSCFPPLPFIVPHESSFSFEGLPPAVFFFDLIVFLAHFCSLIFFTSFFLSPVAVLRHLSSFYAELEFYVSACFPGFVSFPPLRCMQFPDQPDSAPFS